MSTQTEPGPADAPDRVPAAGRRSSGTGALIGGVVLAIAAVAAVVFLVFRSQEAPYTYNGGFYAQPEAAKPLNLTDTNGKPFSLDQLKGNAVVVYFGYTTCPDICPTTLIDYQVVKEELGADADRVKFVLVTIDPERDTQEKLKEYLAFFDPEFIGLRGDAAQTEQVERDYGVLVHRVEYPDSATKYLLDHSTQTYVIDPQGRLALTFPYGMDPALMAQDIRHLLNS
ncbi:MAG: SCO family protein [Thermomicrobiales bacterium]|nr:SCO family protein [Thermomicrobiales bacterium]